MAGKSIINKLYQRTFNQPAYIRKSLKDIMKQEIKKESLVVDIGGGYSPYKELLGNNYVTLDIQKNSSPNIVADAHALPFKSDSFNVIVLASVLEHLHNPWNAIKEFRRILKENGKILFSTPFMHRYHNSPNDYYRYTKDALNYLFRDFKMQKIETNGGVFSSLTHIIYILTYALDRIHPIGMIARIILYPLLKALIKLDKFDKTGILPKSFVGIAIKNN